MAVWDADRLEARMREVIEDAAGTLRTITAGRYIGGLAPGLDVNEEARRGLGVNVDGTKVPTEARVSAVRRSPASPPTMGNLALYEIDVEVRSVYPYTSITKLSDDGRSSLSGLAAASADRIAQAFGYPGNLLTTSGGQATGLVSGLLSYVGSSMTWKGTVNGAGGTLEAIHRFKGVAKSAPAVS